MNDSHLNMLNHIAAHVSVTENRMTNKFNSAITQEKEPFLREIIEATKNGKPLETKYTASDILTILEKLQESFPIAD